MTRALRVLLVEDRPEDAELVLRALRRAGIEPEWRRVDTEADYMANLDPGVEIILCDYALPQFSASRALELLEESGLDIPFIIVSGTIGEEMAVEAMKQGAVDFLLKDRLGRLGQAVEHAMDQRRLRKEAEEAREAIHEQAALLDEAQDAIGVTDLEDRVLYWNRSAERIYGWTRAEVCARPLSDMLRTDAATEKEAHEALMKDDKWSGELEQVAKDGRKLTVEARRTLVRDRDGKPKSILSIATDITDKKKTEAQFLRAQRMESIGTLAGGIAHDLNNSLAPILMAVEVLKTKVTSKEGRKLLELVAASAQHGTDLVSQVLSFARGVEGKSIIVNLIHLLNEIQEMIQDTFPKNIDFCFTASHSVWTVTGDPTHLRQVLTNLCVNARDAMPNGGKLSVALGNVTIDDVYAGMDPDSKPGAYVMVKVEDTGSGIPQEIRDRIFEPFFTTKEIGKGTGLGLSTTAAIIKSHGGFINLESEMGRGTTFKVYLPANPRKKAVNGVTSKKVPLPRGNGETVLLVDDEERLRAVAQNALEQFGYRVLLAGNGAEAVAMYAQRGAEIAAVITDMAMPVMDGPATIIALKALNPNIKVIGSSGLASDERAMKAMSAGATYFLQKPCSAAAMLTMLRTALDGD